MDTRTENYLQAIKNNLNHVGSNDGWYGIDEILEKKGIIDANLEKIASYSGYVNSSSIDIYSYIVNGEKHYCAQLSYRTDIDDYNVETHIFSKYPSEKTIKTIRSIHDLESKFKYHGLKPEFTCWECGCPAHWLDIDGNLDEKINGLEDQYCGC